jgi:tetratricopeptide (TPR) repeat protein
VKTVLPHYEPRQDVQDIIALCHALDGNPSGIVLAAKSLKWRSVRETLESVRTASLAAGVGRAQSRLGQAAIGVVENLSKNARAVFLASSILKSPWSVEDASSIADISLSKVASAIPELVDAGLIEVGVLDNRYSVSPSFVTVAPKCATEKEMATLSERHRDHFVSLVCKSVLKFSTSEQGSALASLDHYRLDVATAFGDLLGPSGSSESFANAIVLSWSFWYKCNRLTEGLELIKAALRGIAREEDYQRARLLNVCGILSHKAGDAKTSRNAFKQCIKIAKRLDHKGMLGAACLNLANLEWSEGSPLAAIRLFEEAGEFQRQSNDRIGLGKSLIGSVASYVELGRIEEAIRANQDGRALLQKLEDGTNQWALCIAEGIICSALRQLQPARLAFVRSARLAGEVHDDASLSRSLLWLAQVENLANRAELAAEFLGAMRVRGSESGTHLYPANELRAASVEGAVKATIGETELRRRKFLGGLRSIEELLESCEENKG